MLQGHHYYNYNYFYLFIYFILFIICRKQSLKLTLILFKLKLEGSMRKLVVWDISCRQKPFLGEFSRHKHNQYLQRFFGRELKKYGCHLHRYYESPGAFKRFHFEKACSNEKRVQESILGGNHIA